MELLINNIGVHAWRISRILVVGYDFENIMDETDGGWMNIKHLSLYHWLDQTSAWKHQRVVKKVRNPRRRSRNKRGL